MLQTELKCHFQPQPVFPVGAEEWQAEETAIAQEAEEMTAVDTETEASNQAAVEVPAGNTIPIAQFIERMGDSLLQAINNQHPPVYSEVANPQRATVLANLKRQPFAAQANVVQAITRLLIDANEKAAMINADMGTGKTMMGIATAAIMASEGYPRTLILSPPHLVYKWRREILETVPNAKVWILNGPDALSKLMEIRERINNSQQNKNSMKGELPETEFFILGRVRLRLGFHWRPAFQVRRRDKKIACPDCGKIVQRNEEIAYSVNTFPTDKRLQCAYCHAPLWTLIHKQSEVKASGNRQTPVLQALCALPTIGKKGAEKLLAEFGEAFIANLLEDNIWQFINLMDKEGKFVFSDSQMRRLEKALSQKSFAWTTPSYQVSEFIKRYLPKHFFSLLIIDEGHEYKSVGSAQGQAMGVIASCVKKTLLLTGTLMGGYAEDLFYLLWRLMPQRMMQEGYHYYRHSLHGAAMAFMRQHGILKQVRRFYTDHVHDHKTARGKQIYTRVCKMPGFGPQGIARHLLPYTAFLRLEDIGQVLPPYTEHFVGIAMTEAQQAAYHDLHRELTEQLRQALAKNDMTLLGVVMHCLLAWPDCCFRPEKVVHPRGGKVLAYLPALLDEQPSPKEEKLIELCLQAKSQGQKALVYTTYTEKRDTATRLNSLLQAAGLKTAVLRASVSTDKREDWILAQTDQGIDVLICHPELVKTGLDLLAFPYIIFMQSGFNLYTLLQASRRSWRIGQKQAVNVYFLGYQQTAQIDCLSLMAKKIAVAQSTSGKMPETGLEVLSDEAEAIEVALAKQLVGDNP